MSDTLLSYIITTNPNPIKASPQTGDPSLATLIIVVSNSLKPLIVCESIEFSFPKGTNANEFLSDSTGIATAPQKGWTIKQDDATFTATPDTANDGQVGSDSLTFVFSNIQVNEQAGTTELKITEKASQTGGTTPAPDATRKTTIPLAKFPPQFEVGELDASPLPPIEQGGSVTLTWSGSSGATYELRYQDADGNTVTITNPKGEPNQPLPSTGSYRIDNLQNETTFYLDVTLPVPGQVDPLTAQRFITVAVGRLQPKITRFTARLEYISSAWNLILNWEASNADYCTITGDAHKLNSTSTDDSYRIELRRDDPTSATYELEAVNSVGSDSSQISVDWQLQLINSVQVSGSALGVTVSPDGTRIFVINHDDSLLIVFDAGTLQPIGSPIAVATYPQGVAISPDGTRLYLVSSRDGVLSVFNAQTLLSIATVPISANSTGIAVSSDGTRLYVMGDDNTLTTFDSQRLQAVGAPITLGNFPQGVAASPDGTRIYVVTDPGGLVIYSAQLQQIGNPIGIAGFSTGIAVSPDGTRIYVGNRNGFFNPVYTLTILNAQTLSGNSITLGDDPQAIACANDPRTYVACDTGVLHVFSEASVTGGKQPA